MSQFPYLSLEGARDDLMSNPHGGRHPTLPFKLPEGWVVVKQHRGITTIKPIKNEKKTEEGI